MIASIRWRAMGPALIVLAIAVVFLLWAQTYPPRSSAVPKLVGWIAIILALIDVASQTETRLGLWLRRFVSAQNVIEWKAQGDEEAAGWGRVLLSVLWVFGYLGGVLAVGFLLTTPIYIVLYMVWHGHKSLRASLIVAAVTTFTIWLTFEIIFRYPLYPGVLFGGY